MGMMITIVFSDIMHQRLYVYWLLFLLLFIIKLKKAKRIFHSQWNHQLFLSWPHDMKYILPQDLAKLQGEELTVCTLEKWTRI